MEHTHYEEQHNRWMAAEASCVGEASAKKYRGGLTGRPQLCYKQIATAVSEVSEEQLTSLIAKISADAVLQEKFRSAADLDSTALMAQEAGFDVTKEDLIKFQAAQTVELSDEELEEVSGGATPTTVAAAAAAVLIVGKALISEV